MITVTLVDNYPNPGDLREDIARDAAKWDFDGEYTLVDMGDGVWKLAGRDTPRLREWMEYWDHEEDDQD